MSDFSAPFTLPEPETAIWASLPDGFTPLPLDRLDTLTDVVPVLQSLAPKALREEIGPATDALATLLSMLAARNTVYCGLGRHRDVVTGQLITSTLALSVLGFPEPSSPRVLLTRLLQARADAGDGGQVDLVDLAGTPAMITESVTELGPGTPVYQLQALVPAPDGRAVAMAELSTSFVSAGPQYRTVLVTTAASIRFTEPEPPMGDTGTAQPRSHPDGAPG
jgi:hypothetical protein